MYFSCLTMLKNLYECPGKHFMLVKASLSGGPLDLRGWGERGGGDFDKKKSCSTQTQRKDHAR